MSSQMSPRAVLTVLGLSVAVVGCGVKQSDLDQQIAAVRAEAEAGDEAVGQRVDQLDTRSQATARDVSNLETEVRRLEQAIEQLSAEMDDSGLDMAIAIRFAVPVHFEFDSYEIRQRDRPLLDRFATVMSGFYPRALVTLEGFADPAGDEAYNEWLGEQRATAVRDYLTGEAGMPGDQVRIVSYGEALNRQVEPGEWGENGRVNRRVSMVVDFSAIQQAIVQ